MQRVRHVGELTPGYGANSLVPTRDNSGSLYAYPHRQLYSQEVARLAVAERLALNNASSAGAALPRNPVGYVTVSIDGVDRRMPYWSNT